MFSFFSPCNFAKMSCSLKSEATFGKPMCRCGVPACLKTSFTKENFGRRFYGCVNYDVRFFLLFVLVV
jgi:hypothetical protein